MSWILSESNRVVLTIRVVPRASKNELIGLYGDKLKIRLHAPPVKGRANKELISFLSRKLDVPKQQIVLLTGTSSCDKRLAVTGISESDVRSRLSL